ncbi:MAG: 4-hydroxythreonine-4-phosphate dehydrogenase PdxA [Propionicimonas sp.]
MVTDRVPLIALTAGDPAGIGPELMVRLALELADDPDAQMLLVSSLTEIAIGCERAGVDSDATELLRQGNLRLLEVDAPAVAAVGEPSAEGGTWSLRALEQALDATQEGRAHGIVFGPLNKTSLHLAGMTEPDEMRWFEHRIGSAASVSEVNIGSAFWTSRVTSHVPFREVADQISATAVADACVLLDGLLRADGRAHPRIAVAALNPHAGENGRFGNEETAAIAPGIALARDLGVDASGPHPADTVFRLGFDGLFDGIVTMYHDQGQIALKTRSFDGGVTLEAGLGLPICTPAHGTAFDRVGRQSASLTSMRNAMALARRLAIVNERPPRR